MCFGGGGAGKIAKQQRADEVARQARIKAGMAGIDRTFGQFDDGYYNNRGQAYIDYAMPQVDRQLEQTRKNLIYALSRTGNLDSSAANERNSDLLYEGDVARTGVANEGLNQQNQARSQVENVRSNIVAELNATGDSSASAQSALRQAVNLNTPVGYSPLGNLFASFAQTLGNIGANAGNGYSGFGGGGGASLFGSNRGSQTVVGG